MVDLFFSKTFENGINESMFFRNYNLDRERIIQYINDVVNVPIAEYIESIIVKDVLAHFSATSVVQFSSIYDATAKLCEKFEGYGDEGFQILDIGKMLLDDGMERKDMAYRKYGENHVKTAFELGLVQECYDHYYLSCIGKIYNELDDDLRCELLRRTVLRNAFVQRIIKLASTGKCSIREQLSFLSESTIKRRLPNIKTLFQILKYNDCSIDIYLRNIQWK